MGNHLYILHNSSRLACCFTGSELVKLHYQFMHPTTGKLNNLIKRAYPAQASTNFRTILEQISKACSSCAAYSNLPFRFRATIPPDKIIFNREVSIDFKWLNKKAVLHMLDTASSFQNATFIKTNAQRNFETTLLNVGIVYIHGSQKSSD